MKTHVPNDNPQKLTKHKNTVLWNTHCIHVGTCLGIIESVDSICRDGTNTPIKP